MRRCAGLGPGGGRLLAREGGATRPKSGPSPVDRARPGSKHHVLTDAQGIPLATKVTGANEADVTQLLPLVDAIPDLPGPSGDKPSTPAEMYADRAYDSEPHRRRMRRRRSPARPPSR